MRGAGITFVVLLAAASMGVGASVDRYVVEVAGSTVTVGEVLLPGMECEGDDSDLGRAVVVGLRPGERRVLTPAEVHLRLKEVGVDAAAHGWAWSRAVDVRRLSQAVSAAALVAAGEAAVRGELGLRPGDEATVTPVMFPRPLLAPVGEIELSTMVRRPALRGGLWVVTVAVRPGEGSTAAIDCVIRYRVQVMAAVLVTCGSVGRHETVDARAVRSERREISSLRGDALRGPEELAGRRAVRGVGPGRVVSTEWLEAIPAVRRGQLLAAVSRVGPVVARTLVTALADGGVGELIPARVGREKRELLIRVTGPGQGEVIVSP